MKVIENITKIFKMIAWLLMGVACAISIVGSIMSFEWIKSGRIGHVFPSNED